VSPQPLTAVAGQPATAGDVVGKFLDARQRRGELIGDLLAATGDTGHPGAIDPDAFITRPSILRRLAALLADDLPTALDRLGAVDQGGVALTTALALHTGLPYAVLDPGNSAVTGEIHRGEYLSVIDPVTTTGARALQAVQLACAHGAAVTSIHTVLARGSNAQAAISDAGYTLYALFSPADFVDHTKE
jgi:orotate phosphoribosyltransferase